MGAIAGLHGLNSHAIPVDKPYRHPFAIIRANDGNSLFDQRKDTIVTTSTPQDDSPDAFGAVNEVDLNFGAPGLDPNAESSYSCEGFAARVGGAPDDRITPGHLFAAPKPAQQSAPQPIQQPAQRTVPQPVRQPAPVGMPDWASIEAPGQILPVPLPVPVPVPVSAEAPAATAHTPPSRAPHPPHDGKTKRRLLAGLCIVALLITAAWFALSST